ncbi:copper homeostasis periplasmic binding protein CopC [Salmonella enterica]|nr:copper homeostasis periplasmic binding protein CopC [Salmonella enterica]EKC7222313.1 copper homeostasis periplasmic binding protein CopC [Salmonella enterica]
MRHNRLLTIASATHLIFSLLFSPPVLAHAHLKNAAPAAESTVESVHGNLTLHFTEALEPAFSRAYVTDSHGKTVTTHKAVLDDTDRSALIIPVDEVLPSGKYTVNWQVVAEDGHQTKGSYTFTVK